MNREEQKKFVVALCNLIAEGILVDIEVGNIPENWDGLELRQLISDHAIPRFSMDKKRLREYKNTVLVNNL